MALLKDMSELDQKGKKGDWCFMSHKTAGEDAFICILWGDDTTKNLSILPIKPGTGHLTSWQWDGNKNEPTITPSILVHPSPGWTEGWHGFLTKGQLITV
jgi:hypothetical protein